MRLNTDVDEDDYNSSHVSGIVPFQSANNTLEGTTFYTCQNCSISTDCGCSKMNDKDKLFDTPCSTKNLRYIVVELYNNYNNRFMAFFTLNDFYCYGACSQYFY